MKAILPPSPLIAGSKLACTVRGTEVVVTGWTAKADGTALSSRYSNVKRTARFRRDASAWLMSRFLGRCVPTPHPRDRWSRPGGPRQVKANRIEHLVVA